MISYANAHGIRAPHNSPSEPFDHSKLFSFPHPFAGTVCCQPAKVITPPPAQAVRTVRQEMSAERKKPDPNRPKRARTAAIQAVIDQRLAMRIKRFKPAMAGKGWMTVKEIADALQTMDDTARSILRRMEKDGQVEFWKKSHKLAFYRWIATKLQKD